jgi:hypothetical protein
MRTLLAIVLIVGHPFLVRAQPRLLAAPALPPPSCSSPPFDDVPAGDPYCPWIEQLAADQVTAGCGGGSYCPKAPVTREEMAMLLERSMRGTASWNPSQGIYQRTIIVSPVPGDQAASGQRLLDAMVSITAPSGSNRWAVMIEPGDFDLGQQPLTVPDYVTLIGAGRDFTSIRSSHAFTAITLALHSALVDLDVEATGSAGISAVDMVANGARIERVHISAGATGPGSVYGVKCLASCSVVDSTVGVSSLSLAYAIWSTETIGVSGTTASANGSSYSYGLYVNTATATLEHSRFTGLFADNNFGIASNGSASVLTLDDVVATAISIGADAGAESKGLRVIGAATIDNSRIEAPSGGGTRYGLACLGDCNVEVHHSRLVGSTATVIGDTGATIDIGDSQLRGAAVDANGGTVRCALVYSENYGAPALTGCF